MPIDATIILTTLLTVMFGWLGTGLTTRRYNVNAPYFAGVGITMCVCVLAMMGFMWNVFLPALKQ